MWNKLPTSRRIQERSKAKRRRQSICPTNLPESSSLESIMTEWCPHHQEGPWVRGIDQKQPETNPVTIKPGTVSHMAEQSSWIHFQGSDKSSTLWLWKWSPFLQYLHLSFLISVMGLWSSRHNQRTLASSLMGHRCPQHLPSSTGFMASH